MFRKQLNKNMFNKQRVDNDSIVFQYNKEWFDINWKDLDSKQNPNPELSSGIVHYGLVFEELKKAISRMEGPSIKFLKKITKTLK